MAGIQKLEELIKNAFEILNLAKKLGTGAWSYTSTTLTIKDPNLAAAVHKVIDGADQAALEREAADLSVMEILKIVRVIPDLIKRLLGG